MSSRKTATLILCVACFTPLYSAYAKIGFRQLCPTTPVAVQRGKKSVIQVRTSYTLNGAYKVFFDKPGMTMRCLETKPIAAPRRGRGSPGTPFRFEIDVPKNQPLGVYEFRVATRTAMSSVAHVLVTEYPVTVEQKKNDSLATAQTIQLPTTIAGTVERSEDVDYYRFAGKKGQPMTFNIYAQRVTRAVHSMQSGGSGGNVIYLMDAILTLYGPNGQVVAQNDNHFGGDSLLTCTLPATGEYVLQVRDSRYIGNGKYVYAVEVSDQPYVHAVFPMSVQVGTSAPAQLLGHGLGQVRETKLTSQSGDKPGWKTTRISTSRGNSNPVSYLVSKGPQRVVHGRNNSVKRAMAIQFPIGLNGRLNRPDQAHYFRFQARKGKYYLFEVSSNRLHLPLDCVLEVYNAQGRKVSEADDGSTRNGLFTNDTRLDFRAPSDGEYTISIRDLQDRGGSQYCYHLRCERTGEDFAVGGHYYYAQLAPGTNMMWFATISRRNGFRGPVQLQVDGLPKGVTYTPVTVPGSSNRCGIILSAARDAKIDASLVRVRGTATIKDPDGKTRTVTRNGQVTCELQVSGGSQARCPIGTQLVGVTNPLDLLSVEATPREVTLSPGKKATITVRIKRNKSYTGPVTLTTGALYGGNLIWHQLPPGIKMSPMSQARLTGNTLEGKVILEAASGSQRPSPVKRFPFAIMAPVSITFSIETNYCSNPLYLTIK